MKTSFALVDCNSFYCSCEQVFLPKIRNTPVVVLSNNDGVIIARSKEAKEAGLKMGEPHHQAKEKILKNGVHVFSSNFALYGDMSDRVMSILRDFGQNMEIYSIDEAFLDFSNVPQTERLLFSEKIRNVILKCTGIPVSIGIGPTKVLAKVANAVAKKSSIFICDLTSEYLREDILETFPVEDIWGIGRQSAKKLISLGIKTASDLKKVNHDAIEKILTITGRRIVEELSCISSIPLDLLPNPKKQIVSSRSFGKPVFSIEDLEEACSYYLGSACNKLRSQNSLCGEIKVFIHTNSFKNVDQYYNSGSLKLSEHTDSTIILCRAVLKILRSIYKPGIEYKKSGVILSNIIDSNVFHKSLFTDIDYLQKQKNIMVAMDKINKKFGRGSVELASCGSKKEWKMRTELSSPCYTTRWGDLPVAKA